MIHTLPTGIHAVGLYLPARSRATATMFAPVAERLGVNKRFVERATGVKETRVAEDHQTPVTLAVQAAEDAFGSFKVRRKDITLVIYCGMSMPYIEPSPAYECADRLGLGRSKNFECYSLSNACCGVVSGIRTAATAIASGLHKHALVLAGERGSNHTAAATQRLVTAPGAREELEKYVAAYTLGDSGSALVLGPASQAPFEITSMSMESEPENFSLCNIADTHSALTADAVALMARIAPKVRVRVNEMLEHHQIQPSQLAKMFVHQTGKSAVNKYFDWFDLNQDQITEYYISLGNLISCSFPAGLRMAWDGLSPGDKCLGAIQSSGTSVSVMYCQRS